jgi:hypothetical protein
MIVSWFSAGCSSAVATKIAKEKYPDMRIMYIHIDDQHEDTMRFLHDCENWIGQKFEVMQSIYKNVNDACLAASFVRSPHYAPCTYYLKKRVRKEWERQQLEPITYVWGFDCSEKIRAERLRYRFMPDYDHYFPLIENNLSKQDCHGITDKAGIKRPAMYDLGYPNNNCIGCIKGGAGYWNQIKKDFPDVFESRCKLEDITGSHIFKEFALRDLPPEYGRDQKIIVPDCGLFCDLGVSI